MTDKPTDAELKAMWQLHAADIGGIFCYARAVLAKWGQPAQAADSVQEDAALPEGWAALTITHEGQYPEEVAYGPQIMMDRLGKWLAKYFAQAAQAGSVLEDAARLDWLEGQSQVNIERVRYLGADTSMYEVTPFNSTDYNGETLRKAIDAAMAAARKQGEKQ